MIRFCIWRWRHSNCTSNKNIKSSKKFLKYHFWKKTTFFVMDIKTDFRYFLKIPNNLLLKYFQNFTSTWNQDRYVRIAAKLNKLFKISLQRSKRIRRTRPRSSSRRKAPLLRNPLVCLSVCYSTNKLKLCNLWKLGPTMAEY